MQATPRASDFNRPPAQTPPPGAQRKPSPQTRPGGSPPTLAVGPTIRQLEASMPHQSRSNRSGMRQKLPVHTESRGFSSTQVQSRIPVTSNPSSTPSNAGDSKKRPLTGTFRGPERYTGRQPPAGRVPMESSQFLWIPPSSYGVIAPLATSQFLWNPSSFYGFVPVPMW